MKNRRVTFLRGKATGGISVHRKLTEYELQNVLQAINVLVPNNVIISLYADANKNKKADKANERRLTIAEIKEYFNESNISHIKENIVTSCITRLAADRDFFCALSWVLGGICLVVGASVPDLSEDTVNNLYLFNSICYVISCGYKSFIIPIDEYKRQGCTLNHTLLFKTEMMEKSAAFYTDSQFTKSMRMMGKAGHQQQDETNESEDSEFVKLLIYIEKKIYDGNPHGVMTRRDLDLLLLQSLGNSFDACTADDIMAAIDISNQGTITPAELHCFLSDGKKSHRACQNRSSKLCSVVSRVFFVAKSMVTNLLWLSFVSFAASASISVVLDVMGRLNTDFSAPASSLETMAWLTVIGTFSFQLLAYDYVAVRVERENKMRQVLNACVKYSSCYHRDDEIWINYNKNKGLDKESVGMLMEKSGIMMGPEELTDLFEKIDVDNSGILSKDELDRYFNYKMNRKLKMILAWLKCWDCWATLNWTIGGIWYILPVYASIGDEFVNWCYILGALCFLIGAISCVNMAYQNMNQKVRTLVKLDEAIDALMEKFDLSDLRPFMHRFKSPIFDVESQKFTKELTRPDPSGNYFKDTSEENSQDTSEEHSKDASEEYSKEAKDKNVGDGADACHSCVPNPVCPSCGFSLEEILLQQLQTKYQAERNLNGKKEETELLLNTIQALILQRSSP